MCAVASSEQLELELSDEEERHVSVNWRWELTMLSTKAAADHDRPNETAQLSSRDVQNKREGFEFKIQDNDVVVAAVLIVAQVKEQKWTHSR